MRHRYELTVLVTVDDASAEEIKAWAERLIAAAMSGQGSHMSMRLPRTGEGGEVLAIRELQKGERARR